ncbi:hypothetical protein J1N35_001392 [Gossypium stocksii]|uniref:Reverse transcriptase domain-containing protein n=1 Tax=Gossypium stocksii TaxID=47602 RepID=A0A9D3WIX2_9ROSI|nr:hypothetical protein J1N35_001392 [Gossypium stocksii]
MLFWIRMKKRGGRVIGTRCALFGEFMDSIDQAELEIREELEFVVHHEELLWRQKARCDCNLYGEQSRKIGSLRDLQFLNMVVSDEEIKKTLFDMATLKALGSDGLHAIFYQSQWEFVGPSICTWVKKNSNGSIDPDLNNSFIVFIPKVQHPECFSLFCPISLCSVLYKLVMKVIANRFKMVFPKLIGPEQVKFVAGRNINDNIIIT